MLRNEPDRKVTTRTEQNMNKLMKAPPIVGEVTILADGNEMKTHLLTISKTVAVVDTPKSLEVALEISGTIKGHLKEIEEARTLIKAPYIAMGKKIDEAAKKHVEGLSSEIHRIESLITVFDQKMKKADEERQRRIQEENDRRIAADKAERERIEAELRAKEAEAERIRKEKEAEIEKQRKEAAEALANAKSAEDKAKAEKAAAEAAEAQRKADLEAKQSQLQAELDAEDAKEEAQRKSDEELDRQRAAIIEAAKERKGAKGYSSRTTWQFRVVDIHALAKAHPQCVTMTVKDGAVKDLLSAGVTVAGITDVEEVSNTYVRSR